jgi:hypothetical protein
MEAIDYLETEGPPRSKDQPKQEFNGTPISRLTKPTTGGAEILPDSGEAGFVGS